LESGYGQGQSIHEVFQSVLLAENLHGQALPEQLLQLISSRLLEIPETVVRVSAHGFISLANDPVTHIKSAARILKQIADFNQSHPDSGHIIFNCVSVATNLPHTKDNQTLRDLVVATHLLRIAAKTNQPPSSPGLLLLVGDENLCVELRNAGLCVESHGTQPIMPQKTVCCHEIVWNNPVENIHHEHPYKLGDYVVQARLADNGAYATFEGVDQRLARRLIVKIKPRQASNSILQPHAKEGLLEKLQAIGRLSHPNIATLFDIGEQDGMIYFVREYLEGRPVTEVELAGDGFDNGLSALLLKIVRALLHARTHGIHHLNLKPSNIWTNEGQILKITDFYCDHFSIRSHPTPATFLSSKFLAPEIIADSPGDERSDIYSIGVMASELSQAHLAAMDPQSENGWLALIRRATQNDPALRFQTLSELELELRRIQIASLTSPQGQAAR
ncbi:MAG TPA: protein kinase, partial [bacterium]